MFTIRFLLGILCLVNVCSYRVPNGDLLTRNTIVAIAASQLSVRELGGDNRGPEVKKYLSAVGFKEGAPWCAAFLSWVFAQARYTEPRTAWSPALFPLARKTSDPKPADLVGFYYASLGRIAHCGIIETKKNDWLVTIEGNTTAVGSRDGNGVHRKRRHLKTIDKFADWVKKKGGMDD